MRRKRNRESGQGMTEYIVIVALIAVAAIAVVGFFGDVDLTVQTNNWPPRRRELLRWRDLAAELLIAGRPRPKAHAAAFLSLLRFTPASYSQIPFVLGGSTTPSDRTTGPLVAPESSRS